MWHWRLEKYLFLALVPLICKVSFIKLSALTQWIWHRFYTGRNPALRKQSVLTHTQTPTGQFGMSNMSNPPNLHVFGLCVGVVWTGSVNLSSGFMWENDSSSSSQPFFHNLSLMNHPGIWTWCSSNMVVWEMKSYTLLQLELEELLPNM